jgi:hypothetical protein
MEALLKRYSMKLQYFVGSIMNIVDLQRVQVRCFKHNQENKIFSIWLTNLESLIGLIFK